MSQNDPQPESDGKLVVIIPALNEAKTIGSVISRIPEQISGVSHIQVVVVNDGSTDATKEIALSAGAIVVSNASPQGVGAAFHSGIKKALMESADIIVNIDADGQFRPEDIPTLIQPILENKAGFVTATRFAKKEWMPDMPAVKMWGNGWMTRIINFITNKHFTDVSCGFRAYTRETALRLTLFGRFTYTQETFIDLAFKNIAMVEVPLKIRGEREHGKSRVASNLWRYGIKAATIIFRAARDYQPFYFFGVPGLVIFIIGILGAVFLLVHYLQTGQTSPYRSLVSVSGVMLIIGFLLFFISMLADMMHRNRIMLDKMLYLTRKHVYEKKHD